MLTARLRVFELDGDRLREHDAWAPEVEAGTLVELSTDGQLCAIGRRDGSVLVHDFANGSTRELTGHRAPISLLRFTDGEAALISASTNGQVLIRKRGVDGFAERCVPVAR